MNTNLEWQQMNVSCLKSRSQWRIKGIPMVTRHRQPKCDYSKVFTDSHKLPCIQFLFGILLKKEWRQCINSLLIDFIYTKSWHSHFKLNVQLHSLAMLPCTNLWLSRIWPYMWLENYFRIMVICICNQHKFTLNIHSIWFKEKNLIMINQTAKYF